MNTTPDEHGNPVLPLAVKPCEFIREELDVARRKQPLMWPRPRLDQGEVVLQGFQVVVGRPAKYGPQPVVPGM